MVQNDDEIFTKIGSFKNALRENRFSSAEKLLGDIRDRVSMLEERRRQKKVNIGVKHVDNIEYDLDTHESFVAYYFNNKTKYVTGNTIEEAIIRFGEEYGGEF